ncbi:MAG: hypothetical protein H7Z75_16905 [Ferruginibacter sp.]|nr:hypothetical protein [Cytophagales bacterium]
MVALLLAGLSACNGLRTNGSDEPSGRAKRMRVVVGEIREIGLPSRGDTTLQLVGTSENQEIVEVSRRELASEDGEPGKTAPAVFLVKGVTNGTAKVVFSEKRTGEEGPGRIRKTYLVEVVSQ